MTFETAKNLIGSPVHFNAGDINYNGFIGSVNEETKEVFVVLVDGTPMGAISVGLINQEHDKHFERVK